MPLRRSNSAARKSPRSLRVSTLMGVERKLATVLFVDLVDSTGLVSDDRPRDRPAARRPVLRAGLGVHRAPRRDGREVRRRRRDGRVRRPAGPRGRRRAGDPRRARDPRGDVPTSVSRRASASRRARSSSATATRRSRPARRSTSPRGSSRARRPNQILIGPNAYRLTLDRIEVEDVGPVQVRGRDEPIWAWRALLRTTAGRGSPSLQAPLVGRDIELSCSRTPTRGSCATGVRTS